ncbi:MAG: nucleoside triphosphate pyrophosphohydrolase [Gammaproteobacteria bacterium]|nr:MAG: nucleoside triphosphate pyrophosphohydrolase [Gammaproteobacteria bacterium]
MDQRDIKPLLQIMASLRDPDSGCPWDIKQDFSTIAPYTIEEAYEVADAIQRDNMEELRDELGDLLLQVVFHARMAEEAGHFSFGDVVDAICDKMTRRHPHVFGDETIADSDAQTHAWEEHKARERSQKNLHGETRSILDDIARGLPPLKRAGKLQRRAARVGFDWPDSKGVVEKLEEEIYELKEVVQNAQNKQRIQDELGDLLFTCVNLARHTGIDPETALAGANSRFEQRFKQIEQALTQKGKDLQEVSLDEMDTLWDEIKRKER